MNAVDIKPIINTVNIKLIPVETVQYGLAGRQSYEGVEVVDNN